MSKKRLFDKRPSGITLIHEDSTRPDALILEEIDDVEPILKEAKRLSDVEPRKEFRHAAVIPGFVLRKAYREGWFNDSKAWRDWANDPDNKLFRTWPGNL
jgi:hypothetical protein